jgi:hypothetical protein
MNKLPKSLLETEQKYYENKKKDFLRRFNGKFVLIKDNKLIGTFDTAEEAYGKGLSEFGNEPMFIKRVVKEEPTSVITFLA